MSTNNDFSNKKSADAKAAMEARRKQMTSILPSIQPGTRVYEKPEVIKAAPNAPTRKTPSSYIREVDDSDREYDERAAKRKQQRAAAPKKKAARPTGERQARPAGNRSAGANRLGQRPGQKPSQKSANRPVNKKRPVSKKSNSAVKNAGNKLGKFIDNLNPRVFLVAIAIIIILIIILAVRGCGGSSSVTDDQEQTNEFGQESFKPVENTEEFIQNAFNATLNRKAGDDFTANWKAKLDNGTSTASELLANLLFSSEVVEKGYSKEDFLNMSFKAMLNHAPDVDSFKKYSDWIDSGISRKKVFSDMVGSNEFVELCGSLGIKPGSYTSDEVVDKNPELTCYVDNVITLVLGRDATADEIYIWTDAIYNGAATAGTFVSNMFNESEFVARNLTDQEFAKLAYRAILGRDGLSTDIDNIVELIKGGKSWNDIVNAFTGSEEFQNNCAKINIH